MNGADASGGHRAHAKVVTLTGLAIFGGVRARIAFVYGVFPKVAIRLIFKGGQPCLTIFGSVV